jgi:hypothetical protein
MNSTTKPSSLLLIQLQNGQNVSPIYDTLEDYFIANGHVFSIEMLWLVLNLGVCVVGILGNLLCVAIFYRPYFYSSISLPLFAYMRYESVIGVIGNIAGAAYGMNICYDLLPFENTYAGESIIQPYLAIALYNTCYYAKFLIEIVIVVDRILILAPSIGSRWNLSELLKVKRPYLVFLGVCALAVLIDLPFFFCLNTPSVTTLIAYGTPNHDVFTFYGNSKTKWSKWPQDGFYVMLFIYIFKNVVTFMVETTIYKALAQAIMVVRLEVTKWQTLSCS